MRITVRSFMLLLTLTAAAVGLSGCFQEAGTGIEPTPVGGVPLVPPSPTAFMPEPVMMTNTPFVLPTQPPLDVAPQEGIGGAEYTLSPADMAMMEQPSATFEFVEAPKETLVLVEPPIDAAAISAPAMTATAIIAGAALPTPVVVGMETPPGGFIVISTPTPPQLEMPLLDGEMTATAMIFGATETAFARATETATALGILPPTATLLPPEMPTLTPTPDPTGNCIYVVRRGDTTYRVATQFGVTIDQIAQANGLTNPSVIHVGQELTIPGCGNKTPTPGPGVPPSDATPPPGCQQQTYVIQPGDNLYRISLRFGVSLASLQHANDISNIHHIVAGRTLVIPCS